MWKCRAFAKLGKWCEKGTKGTIQKCDSGLLCKKHICTKPLSKIGESCMKKNCKKGLHCTNLEQGPVCTRKKANPSTKPSNKGSTAACNQLKKRYHSKLLKIGKNAVNGKPASKSDKRLIAPWKLTLHSLQCDVQHP